MQCHVWKCIQVEAKLQVARNVIKIGRSGSGRDFTAHMSVSHPLVQLQGTFLRNVIKVGS